MSIKVEERDGILLAEFSGDALSFLKKGMQDWKLEDIQATLFFAMCVLRTAKPGELYWKMAEWGDWPNAKFEPQALAPARFKNEDLPWEQEEGDA